MLEDIRAIPGVVSAGWITNLPPETRAGGFGACAPAAKSKTDKTQPKTFCNTQISSEDYFQTVGVSLLEGRDFTAADADGAPEVVIVNESLARKAFLNQDPIGQKLITMFDDDDAPRTIIGVIRDTRDRGLDAKTVLTVYLPYEQFAQAYGSIAVRTNLPFSAVVPEVRRRIAQIDPSVPLTNFQTIDERIHKTLDEPRFYTLMAGACALMAILFVTLGLYGVVAYSVSRRTAEIGIRMALGARRSGILQMVLAQGVQLAAIGVVVGIALSLAASRILTSFLYQVKPSDPAVLAAASALVIVVTLLASYFPARRASNVDPIVALRHQ
jgi:putative ABC transport system permease protein